MDEKITIRLPEEQILFIKEMQKKYKKNKSEIIRMSIQGWIVEENYIYNPKTKKGIFL